MSAPDSPETLETLESLSARYAASFATMTAQAAAASAPADLKRRATLQARFALAGFALVVLADGSYVAEKWGMTRALSSDDDAQAFLDRVGAPG